MTETQYLKCIWRQKTTSWRPLDVQTAEFEKLWFTDKTRKAYLPAVGNDALVTTVLVFPLRIRDGRVGTAMTDTLL